MPSQPIDDGVLALDQDPPGFVSSMPPLPTLKGATRASSTVVSEIGLGSIPRLIDATSEKALDSGSFGLQGGDGSYRLAIKGDLLAEVEVAGFRAYTWAKLGTGPGLALARRTEYQGAIECGHAGLPSQPATERGLRMGGWTETAAFYAEYDATYDAVTCHGKPTQARETTARALWPGLLYAFVTSSTDSDEIGTLQVLGPATAWVSAAPTATSEQLRPHVGSFSYVSVSLRNGRSASITMSFTDLELDAFQRLRTGRGSALKAIRPKSGSADEPPKEVATVRVVVDIDLDGAGGGVVRTSIEKLAASKVVDASLASAARALGASHLGSPAGEGAMAVSTSKSGAVGIHTIAKAPLDRGCRCDPNDSLCDCL